MSFYDTFFLDEPEQETPGTYRVTVKEIVTKDYLIEANNGDDAFDKVWAEYQQKEYEDAIVDYETSVDFYEPYLD